MTISVKKASISSKPTTVYLSCPPLCGLFSIQQNANGGLSYKVKKNPACRILRLRRVALATFFRSAAVRSLAERFLCHRAKFPMTQKEIAPSRPEVGAISLRIILFLIFLSYSTPDAPEPAPKAALTSHPALSPASCLPGSDQLR